MRSLFQTPAGPPAGCLASLEEQMMGRKKATPMSSCLVDIYSKDRYSGAKNIGNFVANLKRTASAITAVTARKFVSGTEVIDLLDLDDLAVLNKAAGILNHLAGEAESAKRTVTRTQAEYTARYERLLREAKAELARTMAPTAIEEMVVVILWRRSYMARTLQDDVARTPQPGSWSIMRSLDYYAESAREELAGELASAAAIKNVPLAEVLNPALDRLAAHRPKLLEREAVLIAQIKNRAEQDQASAANPGSGHHTEK